MPLIISSPWVIASSHVIVSLQLWSQVTAIRHHAGKDLLLAVNCLAANWQTVMAVDGGNGRCHTADDCHTTDYLLATIESLAAIDCRSVNKRHNNINHLAASDFQATFDHYTTIFYHL
jgi:hypothetical protein